MAIQKPPDIRKEVRETRVNTNCWKIKLTVTSMILEANYTIYAKPVLNRSASKKVVTNILTRNRTKMF